MQIDSIYKMILISWHNVCEEMANEVPPHRTWEWRYTTYSGTVLNTTLKENYLGLTISADMKISEQCGIAVAKGEKSFKNKN